MPAKTTSKTTKRPAKKAPARKAAKRKTPARKAVKRTMAKARAPKKCPECGKTFTANNLARHRYAKHGVTPRAGRQPGPLAPAVAATMSEKHHRTKVVMAYLKALKAGTGGPLTVTIAGIPGMNTGKYNDPEKIDQAVEKLRSMVVSEPNPVRQLKSLERISELEEAADFLRSRSNGRSPEDAFVEIGAQWAAEQKPRPISYKSFRNWGVPARVLKAAGIEPA